MLSRRAAAPLDVSARLKGSGIVQPRGIELSADGL